MDLPSSLQALSPSIVKIVVHPPRGERTVATGFAVKEGMVLTCAHVVLGVTDILSLVPQASADAGDETIDRDLQSFARDSLSWVSVYDHVGNVLSVESVELDGRNDVALLHMRDRLPVVPTDVARDIPLGSDVWFAGYGYTIQTENIDWPLSVARGIVASAAPVRIGGYARRPFLFIHAPTFGGHSGAPLMDAESNTCIGMVNGHMQWGADGVHRTEQSQDIVEDLYVPQPVGYATSFNGILNECALLRRALF